MVRMVKWIRVEETGVDAIVLYAEFVFEIVVSQRCLSLGFDSWDLREEYISRADIRIIFSRNEKGYPWVTVGVQRGLLRDLYSIPLA